MATAIGTLKKASFRIMVQVQGPISVPEAKTYTNSIWSVGIINQEFVAAKGVPRDLQAVTRVMLKTYLPLT